MPALIEVKAKSVKADAEAVVHYDFGENHAEAVEKFTEAVVFSGFRANAKILLQAYIRRLLEVGKTTEGIADSWKPGVQMERISDPIAAVKAKYATMSDDEKAAFLNDLESMG
jgi:hypothetical protein